MTNGSERWTSSEEQRRYQRDGFLVLDRPVLGGADVLKVRTLVQGLVDRADSLPIGFVNDLGVGDASGDRVVEVLRAAAFEPRLWRTAAFRRCRDIAMEILGGPVEPAYEHVIAKPAGAASWTAWHQDTAYLAPGELVPDAVTTWLALSDVPVEMGCMQFLPGTHRSPLPHRPRGGQPGNTVLEVEDPDTSAAVVAPLPAGGVTLHHPGVVHATGPNRTDHIRLAWIIQFRSGRDPRARGRLPQPMRDRMRGRRRPDDIDAGAHE